MDGQNLYRIPGWVRRLGFGMSLGRWRTQLELVSLPADAPVVSLMTVHHDSYEEGARCEEQLAAIFGQSNFARLVKQPCFVLRCFPDVLAEVEGVESSSTGKVFTLKGWHARSGRSDESRSLVARRVAIERQMVHAMGDAHRLRQLHAAAEQVESQFYDWGYGDYDQAG